MFVDLEATSPTDRLAIARWIVESPETVLAVNALLRGVGRAWLAGDVSSPRAALIESPLVPGEPQGFGDPSELLELLAKAPGWRCVEVDDAVAAVIAEDFQIRWGPTRRVVDVVQVLHRSIAPVPHPHVRQLTVPEIEVMPPASPELWADSRVVIEAAEAGRVFGVTRGGEIIGHGSSLAAGDVYADISVHVTEAHRRQGLATAAASLACRAVQEAGLTPVWGTSSANAASLGVARKLGFVTVARRTYLVRG